MKRRIEYVFFRILVALIALMPFTILYVFSNFIYLLLFYVFAYRKKVIFENLKIAFPEKRKEEITVIAKSFYRQFSDVLLETLKGLKMSPDTFRKRYQFRNADIFTALYKENTSAIILGGHFGNWEWGSFSFPLWVQSKVVGVYKPLNNPYIEDYLTQKRARFGLQLANMDQAGRVILKNKNKSALFVLIADQNPSNLPAAHWVSFFDKTTPFLNGFDKIARITGLPIYYYEIQRIKRGHYEISFKLLCQTPQDTLPEKVTQLFKEELEKSIRKNPSSWLWSHRRWKSAKK